MEIVVSSYTSYDLMETGNFSGLRNKNLICGCKTVTNFPSVKYINFDEQFLSFVFVQCDNSYPCSFRGGFC